VLSSQGLRSIWKRVQANQQAGVGWALGLGSNNPSRVRESKLNTNHALQAVHHELRVHMSTKGVQKGFGELRNLA
jgi:hypothetical protein